MYLQITTACNMSCPHCCFACSEDKRGEYMHPKTFRRAVELCEEMETTIEIGGGEPTIHPKFWEFFGAAMASDVDSVWMATNGKKTEIAKALAAISVEDGKFTCELSRDNYHDIIHSDVVSAFGSRIRTVQAHHIANVGSAKENKIGKRDACACETQFILPTGDIKACGCLDAPVIGHVDDDDAIEIIERIKQLESHSGYSCHMKWQDDDAELSFLKGELDEDELIERITEEEAA